MSEHDPFSGDGGAAAEKEESVRKQIERSQQVTDFRKIMAEEHGRRFIWRVLERAGIYRTSFAGSSEQTFFREGERNMGLMLVAEIHEICPEMYSRMIKEAKQNARRITNDAAARTAG